MLAEQLRALGVADNRPLMVHAGLRKLGPVEGGAAGLIAAILEVLTPGGTMLMVLDADPDEPFDHLQTPVDVEDMGILAEVFRSTAGVVTNDHAAARFAAIGPDAAALLAPTPLHDYFGHGSVLERFTERDGLVLRLGANIDTTTLTHYAEYLADVPDKRRVRRRLVRADIGEQWVESLDDTDGIVDWPHGDYFSQIMTDFLAGGKARTGAVAGCIGELIDAKAFVSFATIWMENNLRP